MRWRVLGRRQGACHSSRTRRAATRRAASFERMRRLVSQGLRQRASVDVTGAADGPIPVQNQVRPQQQVPEGRLQDPPAALLTQKSARCSGRRTVAKGPATARPHSSRLSTCASSTSPAASASPSWPASADQSASSARRADWRHLAQPRRAPPVRRPPSHAVHSPRATAARGGRRPSSHPQAGPGAADPGRRSPWVPSC